MTSPPRPRRARLVLGACISWLAVGLGLVGYASPARAAHDKRRVDARTGMLEVPLDELVGAVRRKDRAEIGRVAARIGPARLAEALRKADTAGIQAALIAIPTLQGRARLVGPVTELMTTAPDPSVAAAAAHTMGDLLAAATAADIDDWDVPPDVVSGACAALRTSALLPSAATAVRLAALDALGDATSVCPLWPDLLSLLKDPSPAIRRAAAFVVRPQQRLATGGFASGTRDIDPTVASASVAALCEAMAQPGMLPKSSAREPIWEQIRQLARRMATAAATAPEDSVQMLDCLEPTLASDRQILEGLKARRHTPLGERAAEILERPAGRTVP